MELELRRGRGVVTVLLLLTVELNALEMQLSSRPVLSYLAQVMQNKIGNLLLENKLTHFNYS